MSWEKKLVEEQVIWRYPGYGPHAMFTLSDKHADAYFNSDYLANSPSLLKEICQDLYVSTYNKINSKPDWIITYPPYGLKIGSQLAELFGSSFGYIESNNLSEINFDIKSGNKILLCADDLHTGTNMHRLIETVKAKEAVILDPLVVIANCSSTNELEGHEILSLLNLTINKWSPKECPLCATGSLSLPARKHWQDLYSALQPLSAGQGSVHSNCSADLIK